MSFLRYVVLDDLLCTAKGKEIAKRAAEVAPMCHKLAKRFERFKDLLPNKRCYTSERRAISSIRICDLHHEGTKRLLEDCEKNLQLMQSCKAGATCSLIGCPKCSPERRARETAQVAAYLETTIREREKQSGEQCLLFLVTVTNRSAWARPLNEARAIVTGRRNSLRKAIDSIGKAVTVTSPLGGVVGEVTDIVSSIDYYYDSPPGINEKTSRLNIQDRLEASLDIHLHSLVVFRPYYQPTLYRSGVQRAGFAQPLRSTLRDLFSPSYSVHVKQISEGFTTRTLEQLSQEESARFDAATQPLVEVLSYLGKSTTCDLSSSQERPLIQAVVGTALRSAKSILKGKAFILRSRFLDECHQNIYQTERDFKAQIEAAERRH